MYDRLNTKIFATFAKLFWVFMVACVATACATNKPPENFVLKPVASNDASKRFTYGALSGRGGGPDDAGAGQSERQGGGSAGGQGGRGGGQTISFDQLREGLEDYMALNNYCTQGYFVYDETYNGREYLLHGECQESKDDE